MARHTTHATLPRSRHVRCAHAHAPDVITTVTATTLFLTFTPLSRGSEESAVFNASVCHQRALRRRLQSSMIAPAEGIAKSSMRAGTKVRVRTSAGQLCTGQRLVLVLNAVILSATDDGYVVYSGNPNKTMHVAKDEVKAI